MRKIILLLLAFITVSGSTFATTTTGHMSNPPALVPMKTVLTPHKNSGCNYLVLGDNLPWGSSSVTDILAANGETFSTATSATFPGLNFADYDVIIVLSDQVPGFHTVFAANFPKFVTFVTNGGSLEVHAATCGWNSPCGYSVMLPGGVHTVEQYDNYNDIADPLNPIAAGVTSPIYGTYASHGIFAGLLPGTDIISTATSNGLPTTIQYRYGSGIVTGTTVTYEAACGFGLGWQGCIMLHNNLNYSCSHAIAAIPTVSQWGLIILGCVLLGFGTFYILKMRG
ncbi:MAG: IPTL-CTERM sorting domain-containing protein [Bacteroidetes bacterium]|nr:IPTL-CTERM sorting domain-containing protein [Bacteroidota bacterium]